MKCFFHSADLDGHCSGALVKWVYPDCEMIGIDYGDEFPWGSIQLSECVFMVDFSLQPFSKMLTLNERCRLIWIDHHRTALDEYKKQPRRIMGIQEEEKAGCELTWEYLFPDDIIPYPVRFLGRYDVWDHAQEEVLPFQMGMRLQFTWPDRVYPLWSALFSYDHALFDNILQSGQTILAYQSQQNAKYSRAFAFETTLDGLNLIAVNALLTNSKIFDSVFDPARHQAMCTFGWAKGKWKVSLYSGNPAITDVSAIAKARGGGGHPGAAGFYCDELPFELR